MLAHEARRFSRAPITFGQHLPAIRSYNGFRFDAQANVNDVISMHAYSIYYDPVIDTEPLNSDLVPLACLVAEGLSGCPVHCQEFGYTSSPDGQVSAYRTLDLGDKTLPLRQYFADDHAGATYYQEVLEKLLGCGALGAFAWCFSDYDQRLWHLPPFNTHEHERFFGLTRADGSVKPSGEVMRAFARRLATTSLSTRTIPPLTLDAQAWYTQPEGRFDQLFQIWRGRL